MSTARTLEARELVVIRSGRRILDGCSLTIAPGEAVAIEGPSGSGKSTLVRALALLVEADEGQILLGGVDVRSLPPEAVRRQVAFLAQQPAMFPGTVADNLRAGPKLRAADLPDARAAELIAAVGLPAETLAREARTLSGGEKQRVALARALANDPAILLLDEPTASLDPEAGVQIVELVRTLCRRGLGVVMVTHVAAHAALLGGTLYRCEAGHIARAGALIGSRKPEAESPP